MSRIEASLGAMQFRLCVRPGGDACRIGVHGELDLATLPALELVVRHVPVDQAIVVDLESTEFIGVRALNWFEAEQRLRCDAGGSLVLQNLSRRLRALIDRAGYGCLHSRDA